MIYDYFSALSGVGRVEIGLRPELDDDKQNLGALVLITPGQLSIEDKYGYYDMAITVVDFVDDGAGKDFREMPNFQGINNLQDVLHTTGMYLTMFVNSLDHGTLSEEQFDIRVQPAQVLIDELPNLVAGWSLNIQIGAFHGGKIC